MCLPCIKGILVSYKIIQVNHVVIARISELTISSYIFSQVY